MIENTAPADELVRVPDIPIAKGWSYARAYDACSDGPLAGPCGSSGACPWPERPCRPPASNRSLRTPVAQQAQSTHVEDGPHRTSRFRADNRNRSVPNGGPD